MVALMPSAINNSEGGSPLMSNITDRRETLKPCPFCGSEETALSEPPVPWLVICEECGAEGPYADKRKGAVGAWNTRADSSQ
jgi:Lar family restriction alleviation protein